IFQSFEWNLLALEIFSEEQPYFVSAEDGGSAAIIPAVLRRSEIRLAGGSLFDYREVLSSDNGTVIEPAIEALSVLDLPWKVEGVLDSARCSALLPTPWTGAPYVALRDISPEAFAERHTRARRSLRRLVALGATIRRIAATPDLMEWLYREKAKEPDV